MLIFLEHYRERDVIIYMTTVWCEYNGVRIKEINKTCKYTTNVFSIWNDGMNFAITKII